MAREIITTVYTFAELLERGDKAAIERAEQWLREAATDHEWYQWSLEQYAEEFAAVGVEVDAKDISFSGFWSQGDGASFTGRVVDLAKFVAAVAPDNHRLAWLAEVPDSVFIEFYRTSHHYSHENTCSTRTEEYFGRRRREDSPLYAVLAELEADAEAWRYAESRRIYRELEAEYDALQSRENLLELAEANEYTFTESGKRFG